MANVSKLPPPLTDVSGRLHWLADEMERGELVMSPRTAVVLLLDEEGNVQPYVYGADLNNLEMTGLLSIAATHVALSE